MTMKVTLHSISAGPDGCADAGQPVTMAPKEAKRLIRAGAAQPFDPPVGKKAAPKSVPDLAAQRAREASEEAARKAPDLVLAAIGQLDHGEDEDWTGGGKPSMDSLKMLTQSKTLTRAEVDAIAPDARRVVEPVAPPSDNLASADSDKSSVKPAATSSGPRTNKA